MPDFMEEMGLHHFGFDDNQIAQIDAAIPKAAFVLDWVKQHKTVLLQLIDTAEMAAAQIAKFQKEQQ